MLETGKHSNGINPTIAWWSNMTPFSKRYQGISIWMFAWPTCKRFFFQITENIQDESSYDGKIQRILIYIYIHTLFDINHVKKQGMTLHYTLELII